ncbi:MAG TPA: dienelactone hydrolase family protein, partial [Arenicellales bacterium]|nr:dienelactone hydrolase family protein [Arenicellales bacterium]
MWLQIQRLAAAVAVLFMTTAVQAALQSETIEYDVDGAPHSGYLVYDDAVEGARPGVLVVHEWWGHNEFARQQAEELARAGYTAFALDMYGEGKVADHPDDAQAFMQEATSDPEGMAAKFREAMAVLQGHETVDGDRIAAQGYCFGGAVVLNMARAGMDLDGVVSFHGSLGTQSPAEAGAVKAKIRVYTGGADPFVPLEQVTGFIEEMHAAEADVSVRILPGAMHSFMNPGADEVGQKFDMPLAYDEQGAASAWAGTLA